MKNILFILVYLLLLTSCSTEVKKKILIISRGSINAKDNNITVTDGNSYAEKEIDFTASGKITLNIIATTGKFNVDVPADGSYILSLRKDTIIGSYQKIGRDLNNSKIITQEEIKIKIDSLQKLISDANVSAVNRNFFITQNQLQKISDNIEAKIYGPFKLIPPTLQFDKNGKEPELYKFYTIAEMHDLIDRLIKVTKGDN